MKVSLLRHAVARTALCAVGVVALASAAVAGASSAGAAQTWTTKAGSAPKGTVVTATGATTGATPQIRVQDVTSGTTATCDSGTGSGFGTIGTGLSGKAITTLDASKLKVTNCQGPLQLQLLLTAKGLWTLDAQSYSNGVTTGVLNGVNATIKSKQKGQCSFKATGTVKGSFTNSTQTITTDPNAATLTISKVVGCFGLISNGDKGTISLSLKLTPTNPAYNPLTITSP